MKADYRLTLVERPTHLNARATGTHSHENALRFLREAFEACVARGRDALLLELALSGPSIAASDVFDIVTQRSMDGAKLRKIAYIDASGDRDRARFAETVAVNRGVNVRLFEDVAQAEAWLAEGR